MEHIGLEDNCSEAMGSGGDYSKNKVVPVFRSSGLFHCPQCNQGFKQRSNAQSHFKSVHLNVKKQCTHCWQYFKKLKSHIQDVHSVKKLITCKICGKEYQEGRLFKDHMNKTHFQDQNGNPHEKYLMTTECDVCGKYVLKSRFETHMRLKHYLPSNYVVECQICGAHVKYLPWHLQKFHKKVDYSKTMKKCDQCDQWFLKSEDLENHLIDHEKYFCFDCLINFDSHLKLAKHMYAVHKKVFNVGKTFKLNKNKWDKTCSSAVTYHIEKPPDQEKIQSNGISTIHLDLNSSQTSVGNGSMIQEHIVIDNELLNTLEEESFTVVLDEKGNLQNVILDKEEDGAAENSNRNLKMSEVVTDMTSNIHNINFNISDKTTLQYSETSDHKVLVLEEGIGNESDKGQEYEVDVDGNTNTFQIIIPSERFKKYKSLLSEKGNLMKFIQENLPKEYKDICNDFSLKENKLHERFVTSKKYLPKSLNGVELSPEDEDVLNKAPRVEDFNSKDLLKYQIGKREEADDISNKYQACPSRQAHLCPYCRKVLKSRNSLSRHISVVHLDNKKFICNACEKPCATKADLVKHQKAAHDETGKELVKCDICDEKFKACYLKRHKYYKHATHNLPKHCHDCGKEFKTREIMLKHVKKIHLK